MTKEERAILIGLCLGDGHINVRNRIKDGKYKYESSELRIVHSIKQHSYCVHKAELVRRILGGSFTVKTYHHSPPSMKGKKFKMSGFSKSNKYWKQIKKWLYPNGKKTFTRELLNKCNAHSLALFYMDDGHLRVHRNKDGFISSCQIDISTMCSKEEAETIIDWIKDSFDVQFNLGFDKRCSEGNQYFIRCNTKEARKFGILVQPYIIDSMKYKIAHIADAVPKSAEHPKG